MQDQYSRTQLLLGAEAMTKLHDSRVAVFGVGGVGGYTVEALARSGVGALDLIDDDKVCLTNLNRQIIATHKTKSASTTSTPTSRSPPTRPSLAPRRRTASISASSTTWWTPSTLSPVKLRWS